MGPEDETRPVFRCKAGQAVGRQGVGVRSVERVRQCVLKRRQLGNLGMLCEGGCVLGEARQVAAEPPRVSPVRWVGGDIGARELAEVVVAKIGPGDFVVVAEDFDEAQHISVAVNTEQHAAILARAVVDIAEHRIVASKNAGLEAGLKIFEARHSAAESRACSCASRAILRAMSSSATTSASGGMLSSRSIMVETGPKCVTACR